MIDKNFAPPGFEAEEADDSSSCCRCAFELCAQKVCDALTVSWDCASEGRPDGLYVIFVVRSALPATANFPCDDMGTPV